MTDSETLATVMATVKASIEKYENKLSRIRLYMKAVAALSSGNAKVEVFVRDDGGLNFGLEIPKEIGTAFYKGKIKDLQEQAQEFEKRIKEWK